MKAVQVYQVDAFTNECFKGNPAGVCILEEAVEDKYMQLIAKEMNLSETAFVQSLEDRPIKDTNIFSLRWFTPKYEVDLCGHATIAASEILFNRFGIKNDQIMYETKSGRLIASKAVDGIALDFPIDEVLNMLNNFKVLRGDVETAINIMKEVTKWGRSIGLNVWKDEHLTMEKLLMGIN